MDFIKKPRSLCPKKLNIAKGFINAEEHITKVKKDDSIIEKSEKPKVGNENSSRLRIQTALEVLGLDKMK